MPKQFKGQVLDNFSNALEGVKVTINGTGVPSGYSTTTDPEGKWLITLEIEVNSIDVTITFSKAGFGSKSITNPQPTSELDGYIDPEKGGILDLAGKYPSGLWKVSSLPQNVRDAIDMEIKDIYTFITFNPGNYTLTIDSSESKVPNHDNEEGKTKEAEFQTPGALAKARAIDLQEYVNKKLDELYLQDSFPTDAKPVVKLGIIDKQGGPDWDGINADNNKYTQHQYTRLKAEFITSPSVMLIPECFTNFKIQINYNPGGHVCNDATYRVYVNNVLLYRDDGKDYASLNNGSRSDYLTNPNVNKNSNSYRRALLDNNPGDQGGARTNQFTITPTLAKQFLEKFDRGYVISMACWLPNKDGEEEDPNDALTGTEVGHSGDCHDGIGTIVIIAPDGSTNQLNVSTPGKRNAMAYLAELDPCNPLIFTSTDVGADIDKAQDVYLKSLYKNGTKASRLMWQIETARKQRLEPGNVRLNDSAYRARIEGFKDQAKYDLRRKNITKEEFNKILKLIDGSESKFGPGQQLYIL
jgi:hypothetical protein